MRISAEQAAERTAQSAAKLNAALSVAVASVEGNKSEAVQFVALHVMQGIQKRWPVDTGRSRAAWNPGVRAAGGTVTQKPGSNPLAVALGNTEGYGAMTDSPSRAEFVAVNGTRYSPFLEAGHSKQARAGVVNIVMSQAADDLVRSVGEIEVEGTQ